MIDCIPQTGFCPIDCSECYYNREGAFYRELNTSLIPTLEEAKGKIVRINSGHDSNLLTEEQLELTGQYPDRFYCTSLPRIDKFDAPVQLTINGRDTDETYYSPTDIFRDIPTHYILKNPFWNLMLVRFRVNTWNLKLCKQAIDEWTKEHSVPFLLTDMRYYHKELIKEPHYYNYGKHILNEYWKLNDEGLKKVLELTKYPNVFWCGNPFTGSTLCKDCMLCEILYMKIYMKTKLKKTRENITLK